MLDCVETLPCAFVLPVAAECIGAALLRLISPFYLFFVSMMRAETSIDVSFANCTFVGNGDRNAELGALWLCLCRALSLSISLSRCPGLDVRMRALSPCSCARLSPVFTPQHVSPPLTWTDRRDRGVVLDGSHRGGLLLWQPRSARRRRPRHEYVP